MPNTLSDYLLGTSDQGRLVLKVGSSLLVRGDGSVRAPFLSALAADIARLHQAGWQVAVVSSGAVGLGRGRIGDRLAARDLETRQAAAAIGQPLVMRAWQQALGAHDLITGQLLLTLALTDDRRGWLNARATMDRLFAAGAVPVINENDSVATAELKYGDNDRLAAHTAQLAGARLLILLSDVDGLFTANPHADAKATLVREIDRITPDIRAMAGGTDASGPGTGGMATKLDAAQIAGDAGCETVILNGLTGHDSILFPGDRHSWFRATGTPSTARRQWIAARLKPQGQLHIDEGAAAALARNASLLPAGVREVSGSFRRGDLVDVVTEQGQIIARGLCHYDAAEAGRITGVQLEDVAERLGYAVRRPMIHRDDLVLSEQPLR